MVSAAYFANVNNNGNANNNNASNSNGVRPDFKSTNIRPKSRQCTHLKGKVVLAEKLNTSGVTEAAHVGLSYVTSYDELMFGT